jgi:glycosyltransferase involved in cell wall biosynthesis
MLTVPKLDICFIAPARGLVLSGGDKIFIELAKQWEKHKVSILTSRSGAKLCEQEKVKAQFLTLPQFGTSGVAGPISYFLNTALASLAVPKNCKSNVLYSTSDYLFDVVPALRLRRQLRDAKWVAKIYHLIPPLNQRKGKWLVNWLAVYNQRLSHWLIQRQADAVFVDNALLRQELITLGMNESKVFVSSGGVNISIIDSVPESLDKYDAIFVARLHPSKGIFDLPIIWKRVTGFKPQARLAIIGWGSSRIQAELQKAVSAQGLAENIDILGYVDDTQRVYSLIKSSRLAVAPSYEEGWGISICEAMACKVPVVAYDLPVYHHVFGDVIHAVPIGNTKAFARAILDLLDGQVESKVEQAYQVASRYDWARVAQRELNYFCQLGGWGYERPSP